MNFVVVEDIVGVLGIYLSGLEFGGIFEDKEIIYEKLEFIFVLCFLKEFRNLLIVIVEVLVEFVVFVIEKDIN